MCESTSKASNTIQQAMEQYCQTFCPFWSLIFEKNRTNVTFHQPTTNYIMKLFSLIWKVWKEYGMLWYAMISVNWLFVFSILFIDLISLYVFSVLLYFQSMIVVSVIFACLSYLPVCYICLSVIFACLSFLPVCHFCLFVFYVSLLFKNEKDFLFYSYE